MKRFFTVALTVVAMSLVAILTAMISLRLAIHGREVAVPDLAGLSDTDAAAAARRLGLNVSVENRFYSAAVTANHVLSQAPIAGSRVRRGWQVRVTESLGGQHVAAPDLTGAGERPAMLMLSRLQLTLAPEAHIPAPGPTGIVVAQSPPPNTADVAGPQVSLLVSGPEPDPSTFAYVMPRIIGMRVAAAAQLLASAGLRLAPAPGAAIANPHGAPTSSTGGSLPDLAQPPPATQSVGQDPAVAPIVNILAGTSAVVSSPIEPPSPLTGINPAALILTQSPAPGQRITRADLVHVGFVQETAAATAASAPPATPDAR
jgi:hypothetical protein